MTAVDDTTNRFDAPIIGRETDLADVVALMDDRAPLVTVTGRGGVGKTRLAREVIATHHHARGRAAALVDLTPVRDPDLVLPELTARLGVPVPAGGSILDVLADGIGDADLLLVLDNFEHVLPAAADVGALLERCPGLRLLVTSQAPLRLRTERVVQLDPLPVPADDDGSDPADNAAVRLYCGRARAVTSSFTYGAHNATAIAELCRRLEGLPLAIELAAVRAGALPAAEILQRLDDMPFELLRGPMADVTPRHHDLHAAIAWTDGLLDEEERRLLRSLSVAAGPVTLDRAAALDDAPVPDTIGRMARLHDFRLVDRVVDSEPARYAMPWSIAEFGREAIAVSGRADAVRRRYVTVVADLADEISRGFRADAGRWLHVAADEMPELLHALEEAVALGAVDDGLRLLRGLGPVWRSRGLYDVHLRLFDRVLGLVGGNGADPVLLAEVLGWSALLDLSMMHLARNAEARERMDRSLELARASGSCDAVLRALSVVVLTAQFTGDYARARESIEEARGVLREDDDYWDARFTAWEGMIVGLSGDVDGAVARGRRALGIARRTRDPEAELIALILLRPVAAEIPEVGAEVRSWTDSVDVARRHGFLVFEAMLGPQALADVARSGDVTAALTLGADVLRFARPFGREPLGTLALVASVELFALVRDDACVAMVHGLVRDVLPIWEIAIGRVHFPRYLEAVERAESRLGADAFLAAAAEGAVLGAPGVIAHALDRIRALAGDGAGAEAAAAAGLTPRQLDVLRLAALGATNKEIAADLGISAKTVTHHLTAVFLALGVRTRTEAALWAAARGLTD